MYSVNTQLSGFPVYFRISYHTHFEKLNANSTCLVSKSTYQILSLDLFSRFFFILPQGLAHK